MIIILIFVYASHSTHLALSQQGFCLFEHQFALSIARVKIDSCLVVLDGFYEVSFSLLGHRFSLITFGPDRCKTDASVCVYFSLIVLRKFVVCCRPVTKNDNDLIPGCELYRLSVIADGCLVVFLLVGLIALFFESYHLLKLIY